MRDERAWLGLEDYGVGGEDLKGMPHVGRVLDAVMAFGGVKDAFLNDLAAIVVKGHPNASLQDDEHLGDLVVMDGHDCAHLHGVQKPLARVAEVSMEIIVHPQSRTFGGLTADLVHETLGYDLQVRCVFGHSLVFFRSMPRFSVAPEKC